MDRVFRLLKTLIQFLHTPLGKYALYPFSAALVLLLIAWVLAFSQRRQHRLTHLIASEKRKMWGHRLHHQIRSAFVDIYNPSIVSLSIVLGVVLLAFLLVFRCKATLEDYAMARTIVSDTFRSSLYQLSPNTRKIIQAVRDSDHDHRGATYQDLVKNTGMTYAVVYRWAKPALQAGYLNYSSGTEKSNQKRLQLGASPSKDELLPSPKLLLRLHPEINRCRYISPLSGNTVTFKAPLKPQKAIKAKADEG